MGGIGNVRGTLFAAMLLGIAESLVAAYIGLQYRDTVGFVDADPDADVATARPVRHGGQVLMPLSRTRPMSSPTRLSRISRRPRRDLRLPLGIRVALAALLLAPLFLGSYTCTR